MRRVMKKNRYKFLFSAFALLIAVSCLVGCVDQNQDRTSNNSGVSYDLIATSPAVANICDKLNLDLVAVCNTGYKLPEQYEELPRVGMPMSPDLEKISSINPDYILSPATLKSDLEPKYQSIGQDYIFLDLKSVQGMYSSIEELGEKFDRSKEASELVEDFNKFMDEYKDIHKDKEKPKVLVLMGLPGSYIVATENSYVGNLVELAGGQNVFAGTKEEFLNANTEEMKLKEPDIILRAAHGVPDQVKEEFAEEFETNQIWKHFKAVENGRVYDLDSNYFNMSANFGYKEALKQLEPMLYE